MSKIWQQFVSVFADVDTAGVAFLVGIGSGIAAITLPVNFMVIGQYTSAACLVVTFRGQKWLVAKRPRILARHASVW